MTIGYILRSFGTFFPVWVIVTKKNLATLVLSGFDNQEMEAKIK
jgi:hypothetical protein